MADCAELVNGTRRNLLQALAVLLAAPAFSPCAAAQEATPGAPDFSAVTTKRAARRLVREGRLVETYYFPTELGGPDDPMNVTWVTPEAAVARETVIDTLNDYLERDLINQMKIKPEFKGDSIVPSRIVMEARRSGREGTISLAIEVW